MALMMDFSTTCRPREHHKKIHHVPDVAQVGIGVQHQPEGDDFECGLDREDAQEVALGQLQLLGQHRFVSVGQMFLQRQHHAVCDDCQQYGVLERRPFYDEFRCFPNKIVLGKNEQR